MLAQQARLFTRRAIDLRNFIYGERAVASGAQHEDGAEPDLAAAANDESGDSDDELFTMKGTHSAAADGPADSQEASVNAFDSSVVPLDSASLARWQVRG